MAAYITAAELRAVIPDEYRDAALADSGQAPDPGLLQAVIQAASDEVDALIEGRVHLPIPDPIPKKIKTAALYIALEALFIRRNTAIPESTANKITFWRSWLSKIGAGELRLEAAAGNASVSHYPGAITSRPSVTGAGGLIGCILIGLALAGGPVHAAMAPRAWKFRLPTGPELVSPDHLEWAQGESVSLSYADAPREARSVRWEIISGNDLWLDKEAVQTAQTWFWELAPAQTALPAGRYEGRISVYAADGSFIRLAAQQAITVHAARRAIDLALATPLFELRQVVGDWMAGWENYFLHWEPSPDKFTSPAQVAQAVADAVDPLVTTSQLAVAIASATSNAHAYAESVSAAAEEGANAYADTRASEAEANAIAHADAVASNLATKADVAIAKGQATSYAYSIAGAKADDALAAAKTYTDAQTASLASTEQVAQAVADKATRDYVDFHAEQAKDNAIASANDYTEDRIATEMVTAFYEAKNYADNAVSNKATIGQVAQAKADAQEYTDDALGALTPADIGALAAADSPTNVLCAGSWLFQDWFTTEIYDYPRSYTNFGPTSTYNSVYIFPAEHSRATDYLIEVSILRQQDWTPGIIFTHTTNLSVSSRDGGGYIAAWNDGTSDGAIGSCVAMLGEFERSLTFTRGPAQSISTSYVWAADVPGSLRNHINTGLLARVYEEGKEQTIFAPDPYLTGVFFRNPKAWTYGLDLTCASPYNSLATRYRPATAITPQHIIGSKHWIGQIGSSYKFIDNTNGIHTRTLLDLRLFDAHDMAVGLLDSPLGNEITPAMIFDANQLRYLRGKQGLHGAPGLYMISTDQEERAWLTRTPALEMAGMNWEHPHLYVYSSTNLPFSRERAIGGDSGSPSFVAIGTNVVLLTCYWGATMGPAYTPLKHIIEGAMEDMGGSIYTNTIAPDLSAWPDYDTGPNVPDY